MEKILHGDYSEKLSTNMSKIFSNIAERINEIELLLSENDFKAKRNKIWLDEEIFKKTNELREEIKSKINLMNKTNDEYISQIHEIKNHLNVIGGYASTILKYSNKYSENKKNEIIKKIVNECDRMTHNIKDFIYMLSEEENLDNLIFDKVDIEYILNYFYNIYEVIAKEKIIDFIIEIEEPLPYVWGNKEKIEFVVSNIISNAFKYVLLKGIIKIKAYVEDKFVRVDISNSGPIIKDGEEEIIFKKFKSIQHENSINEGTGLGLYITNKIIQKHNGTINVINNQEGGGTTFYFKVPIAKNGYK